MRYPNKQFKKLVEFVNGGREDKSVKIYADREPRKIDWIAYNLSQINNIEETLSFIEKEVNRCDYPPRKAGKPLTDPKILAKIILICEAFGLTERDAQGFLRVFGRSVGIAEIDDRVIGNAYDKQEVAYILQQIFDRIKDSDGILSGDGTGLETTRKQNYESDKLTSEYFISIVDSREIVQAFEMSRSERKAMKKMIEEVKGNSLRLDAGFVDKQLTARIAELGMKPYIFPKKNIDINGRVAWKLMYLELFFDTQEWLREYHQRSHTESFHSSFKRRNKPLLKNNPLSRLTQLTARIIIHNLRKWNYYGLF